MKCIQGNEHLVNVMVQHTLNKIVLVLRFDMFIRDGTIIN